MLPTATYRAAAFVEAARRLAVELTVASERPSTFEASQPDALLTLDFLHVDRAVQRVREFAATRRIDAALGVDDDTVVMAAAINDALGHGTNPEDAVLAARDKHQQRVLMEQARVPIPRYSLHLLDVPPDAAADSISYPCVVKPLRLSASRGVIRANDRTSFVAAVEQLRQILQQADSSDSCEEPSQYLVEEFIPGYEVAVEGLLVRGHLHALALFDKPDPLDGPYFEETIYLTPSRHPEPEQAALVACAQSACDAIGLREGPAHAELRWNERGPWLIELAARPIGGRCSAVLRFGDGDVTLEEIVTRHALGMPLPSLERERVAAGVMMIPVKRGGVLREIRGLDDARSVRLIEDVAITAHKGQRLVPWPDGSRYPGFIFARGTEPALVERALREAHARLEFVLDD